MLFNSSFGLLEPVIYKGKPGVIIDVLFSLDEDTNCAVESFGIQFDDDTYEMYIDPADLTLASEYVTSLS